MVDYHFTIATAYTNPAFYDMVAYVLAQFPALSAAGFSGFVNWTPKSPYQDGNTTIYVAGMVGDFVVQDTQNTSAVENVFNPIWEHINTTWPGSFKLCV